MIEAKNWKGRKLRGVVLNSRLNADSTAGFGFIEPAEGGENIFFNSAACQGMSIERGDEVEFVLCKNEKLASKGPRAYRVWVTRPAEQITTHHGADEYR